ncbi:universal stress protein [Klebsiella michiganensis]|uniref:universal stress protein n=1 Tax=Klebsiella TaxID=570 RepID=UPI003F689317
MREITGSTHVISSYIIQVKRSVENSTIHLTGQSVGDALIRYAEENTVDLIVMGAYGHSRLRQFFIGSHTSEMLQKTQQPLLILR